MGKSDKHTSSPTHPFSYEVVRELREKQKSKEEIEKQKEVLAVLNTHSTNPLGTAQSLDIQISFLQDDIRLIDAVLLANKGSEIPKKMKAEISETLRIVEYDHNSHPNNPDVTARYEHYKGIKEQIDLLSKGEKLTKATIQALQGLRVKWSDVHHQLTKLQKESNEIYARHFAHEEWGIDSRIKTITQSIQDKRSEIQSAQQAQQPLRVRQLNPELVGLQTELRHAEAIKTTVLSQLSRKDYRDDILRYNTVVTDAKELLQQVHGGTYKRREELFTIATSNSWNKLYKEMANDYAKLKQRYNEAELATKGAKANILGSIQGEITKCRTKLNELQERAPSSKKREIKTLLKDLDQYEEMVTKYSQGKEARNPLRYST